MKALISIKQTDEGMALYMHGCKSDLIDIVAAGYKTNQTFKEIIDEGIKTALNKCSFAIPEKSQSDKMTDNDELVIFINSH